MKKSYKLYPLRQREGNKYEDNRNIKKTRKLYGGIGLDTNADYGIREYLGGKIDMFNPLTYWASHIVLMRKYNNLRKELDRINRELEQIKPMAESLITAYKIYDKVSVELLDKYKIIMRMLIAREYEKNRVINKNIKHQKHEVMTNYTNARLALDNIKQQIKAESISKKKSDEKDYIKTEKKIVSKLEKFAAAFEKFIKFENHYVKVYDVIRTCKEFGEMKMVDAESRKKQSYCRKYARDYEKLYNFNAEAKDKQSEVKNLIIKYDSHLKQIQENYKANQGKKGDLEAKMMEWSKKYKNFTQTLNEISEGKIVGELGEILTLIDKIKDMYIRSNDASIIGQVDKYYEALRLGIGDIQEYFKAIQKEITNIYEYILKGGLAAGLRSRINDVAKLHADAMGKFILIHTSYNIYMKTGGWKGKIGVFRQVGGNLYLQLGGDIGYMGDVIKLLEEAQKITEIIKKDGTSIDNPLLVPHLILKIIFRIPDIMDNAQKKKLDYNNQKFIIKEIEDFINKYKANSKIAINEYEELKKMYFYSGTEKDMKAELAKRISKMGDKYFLKDMMRFFNSYNEDDSLKWKINLHKFKLKGEVYDNGIDTPIPKSYFKDEFTYLIKLKNKKEEINDKDKLKKEKQTIGYHYLLKIGTNQINKYKVKGKNNYTFKKEQEIKDTLFYCYCFSKKKDEFHKEDIIKLDDKNNKLNIMILDFKTGFPILSRWYHKGNKLVFNLMDCGYNTEKNNKLSFATDISPNSKNELGKYRLQFSSILENITETNRKAVIESILLNCFDDTCITADTYLYLMGGDDTDSQKTHYDKIIKEYDDFFNKKMGTSPVDIPIEDFSKLKPTPESPAAKELATISAAVADSAAAADPTAAVAADPAAATAVIETGAPVLISSVPEIASALVSNPTPASGIPISGPLPQEYYTNPRISRLEAMFSPIQSLELKLLELMEKIIKKYRIRTPEAETSKINEDKITLVQGFIIALEEEERKMIEFKAANPKDPVIAGWDFKKIQSEIVVVDSSDEIKRSLEVAQNSQLSPHMQLIESSASYNVGDLNAQIEKYISMGDFTGQLLNQSQWSNVRDAFRNANLMKQLTKPNTDGLTKDYDIKKEERRANKLLQQLVSIVKANQNTDIFGYNSQGPDAVAFYNYLKLYKYQKDDEKKSQIKGTLIKFLKEKNFNSVIKQEDRDKMDKLSSESDVRDFIKELSTREGAPAIDSADIDKLIKDIREAGKDKEKKDKSVKSGGHSGESIRILSRKKNM